MSAPLPPARVDDDGVRAHESVTYAVVPGHRPLLLDVFLPPVSPEQPPVPAPAPAPAPAVIFLHGGGWRLGSRSAILPALRAVEPDPFRTLARQGIAVVTVDYRLSGEATWPAQLHDVKSAVRWVRSRADELGLDPTRIAAWGESAGGHLACLLGLVDDPALEGAVGTTVGSSSVCAVAAWYPPTDLAGLPADLGRTDDPTSRESLLLGDSATQRPDLAAQASPLTHVGADPVPFLLRHGDADELVPLAQSRRLADALSAAGGEVELQQVVDGHHMWADRPADARSALVATTTFLIQHLGVHATHRPPPTTATEGAS